MASAAKGAMTDRASRAFGLREAADRGREAALRAGGGTTGASSSSAGTANTPPAWAQQLRAEQASRTRRQVALHALREGDKGGAGASPDIKERD
jgi:type IV secretion system protein TrbL